VVPIFEQGRGQGIGHSSESFSQRFDELCREHLREGRAKAFAFIFYDFHDQQFKQVLRNQGVFTQLDRLSGNKLSVFYLHSGNREAVRHFNTEFLTRLGLREGVILPCVVFFKVEDDQITDVKAVHLESADLIHGLHELYGVIEDYISDSASTPPRESKYLKWVKSGAEIITVEAFKAGIEAFLASMM
jgi:hypothetical protein